MLRGARARSLTGGLLAGLCLTATLPPFGWWPLGPVGVAVLWAALSGARWRHRLAVGGAAGLALYATGLWWATEFHAVGWAVLVLVESAILAVAVALAPQQGRLAPLIALPAALVLAEAIRGSWPFGGLPLAGLDLGQAGGPLLNAARLGGHLFLVGVLGVAGVGLACVLARRWFSSATCIGLAVAATLGGWMAPDGTSGPRLEVAAVQGGGDRGLRAVDADPREVFEAHLAATRAGVRPGSVGLVVWPEDVVEVDGPLAGSDEEAEMARLADDLRAPIVAGVIEEVEGRGGAAGRFRNTAVVWEPGRGVVDRFEKVHRVPFGEYVPFRSLIERVADLSAVPNDALAGSGPGVLETSAGRLGVVISYEVFFADRARGAAQAGGRLLLVPTNASSYTTSQVPGQELAVARLRAVETGRWVVQAAPTGFSAVVDQRGRVVARGPLGSRDVITAGVERRGGQTLPVGAGDAPVTGAAVTVLLFAWLLTQKKQKS